MPTYYHGLMEKMSLNVRCVHVVCCAPIAFTVRVIVSQRCLKHFLLDITWMHSFRKWRVKKSTITNSIDSSLFHIYAHIQYVQMTFTLGSSVRLRRAHLPVKCVLAENGHKQRGECEKPPHYDR